uniref:Uncharacterized protein n=1 Tax=Romanomermis culicivorax TaxID=13658 RepID=A0A915ITC5_ROMCU
MKYKSKTTQIDLLELGPLNAGKSATLAADRAFFLTNELTHASNSRKVVGFSASKSISISSGFVSFNVGSRRWIIWTTCNNKGTVDCGCNVAEICGVGGCACCGVVVATEGGVSTANDAGALRPGIAAIDDGTLRSSLRRVLRFTNRDISRDTWESYKNYSLNLSPLVQFCHERRKRFKRSGTQASIDLVVVHIIFNSRNSRRTFLRLRRRGCQRRAHGRLQKHARDQTKEKYRISIHKKQ